MTSALSSDEPFAESSAWRNRPKDLRERFDELSARLLLSAGVSDRHLMSSQLGRFNPTPPG